MKYVCFSAEEKVRFFEEMAAKFYEANFGQYAKADFELLMFHFYINKLIELNKNDDGIVDYHRCSDYKISKELGITQQRVRNLKVKNSLSYPSEHDWMKSFALLLKNARFDKVSGKIVISILDPNLFIEIQNFIEEQDAYIEKQLNSKLLQLRVEFYIDLVAALEDDSSRRELKKQLRILIKDSGKDESLFDDKNIGRSMIEMGINVTTIAANLTSFISPSNALGQAFLGLMK